MEERKEKEFSVNELMNYLSKIPEGVRDFVKITVITNDSIECKNDEKSEDKSSLGRSKIMTAKQVCEEYFQGSMSLTKLYQLIREKKIPIVQISSGRKYFDSKALDEWVKRQGNLNEVLGGTKPTEGKISELKPL